MNFISQPVEILQVQCKLLSDADLNSLMQSGNKKIQDSCSKELKERVSKLLLMSRFQLLKYEMEQRGLPIIVRNAIYWLPYMPYTQIGIPDIYLIGVFLLPYGRSVIFTYYYVLTVAERLCVTESIDEALTDILNIHTDIFLMSEYLNGNTSYPKISRNRLSNGTARQNLLIYMIQNGLTPDVADRRIKELQPLLTRLSSAADQLRKKCGNVQLICSGRPAQAVRNLFFLQFGTYPSS